MTIRLEIYFADDQVVIKVDPVNLNYMPDKRIRKLYGWERQKASPWNAVAKEDLAVLWMESWPLVNFEISVN